MLDPSQKPTRASLNPRFLFMHLKFIGEINNIFKLSNQKVETTKLKTRSEFYKKRLKFVLLVN